MNRIYSIILFFFLFCGSVHAQYPPAKAQEQYAFSLIERIERENRTVSELTLESLENLPTGIKKHVDNNRYIIGIDSAFFTEQGVFLSVFAEVTLNNLKEGPRKIAFAAKKVLFTPSGIDPTPVSRLVMISQQRLAINDQVDMVLPDDGHNYLEWGCDGFHSINISGILEFSEEVFIPSVKLAAGQDKVRGKFETNTTSLNNILLSVGITPFEVKGLAGMAFEVRQATWDMSETVNPSGFVFPAEYATAYGDAAELWKGFFLEETSVHLPPELGDRTIRVENMLIDEFGLSGNFAVSDVLPLTEGNASGWPFSIDSFAVQLAANKLVGGSMAGTIHVPFLETDTLGYSAQIASGTHGMEYTFRSVFNTDRDYRMPFGGTVRLSKGSTLQVAVADNRFVPSVILNGSMTIDKDIAKMEGIRFEKLHLTAEAPYILGGVFASSGEAGFALAGFGLSIKDMGITITDGKVALCVNAKVSLMNEKDRGISADTRIYMNATVENTQRQKWIYASTDLDRITLDCKLSVFHLHGTIGLYKNHAVYGDGFEGQIDLSIDKILPGEISADIRFGTTPECRYWYAKFGVPVNIQIGVVKLNRIEGGAYNRMRKADLYAHDKSDYLPDPKAGMGFMSGVGLDIPQKSMFTAFVDFEIAFNDDWGVNFMQFTGKGQFLSDGEISPSAPVMAEVNMFFDFDNSVFHANMKTYMNLAGVIRGTGPNNLLGEAVIHSDPQDWYVYIGRPSVPMGVDLLGIAKAQAYFMAGTKIEDMPLPPSTVRSILGRLDLDFMKKENAVSTGRGMGFGVQFDFEFGFGRNGGFVYAYLNLGAGTDILLRNYDEATCDGRTGNIGFDGWYASGQAYAYMQGKIGIRVKRREFDILNVGIAALLQAKLPNPTWMHGSISAKYKVLGGLIKGSVNVEVTIGEECKIEINNSELGDIELIADVQPNHGGKDIDVFTAIQAAFNTSMDTEFGMMNLYDEYHTYRVKFDEFNLIRTDKSIIPNVAVKWNQNRDVAVLKMRDILPGMEQMTASVKVHIEKKNGQLWEALTVKNGAIDYEIRESVFTTGAEPVTIPENNVAFSYPLRNQYNFYKNESEQGYIQLKLGQPNLFRTTYEGSACTYIARFKTPAGQSFETAINYNESTASVHFSIPQGMSNSQIYSMQIVRQQIAAGAIDRNLERGETQIRTGGEKDSTVVAQNRLQGSIGSGSEKVLHEFDFRTSSFNTFTAKLNNMSNYRELYAVEHCLMSLLAIEGYLTETFDHYELKGGGEELQPLVYAEALMSNTWLTDHVYKTVYELYGTDPDLKLNRDSEGQLDVLGLVPLKGMWLFNNGLTDYRLEENQKTGGSAQAYNGSITCRYNIAYYVYQDFAELRNKAAAKYIKVPGSTRVIPPLSEAAHRLLYGNGLNDIYRGRYAFKLRYRLPGNDNVTSEKEYGIIF